MNNKLQKRFAICCLIMMFITPFTTSYAATVEECGKALAEYAISFAESTGNPESKIKTHYYYNDIITGTADEDTERKWAWNDKQKPSCIGHNPNDQGQEVSGSDVTKLGMDCVGWVSYAIHHCYGLGGENFEFYVTPQSRSKKRF